LVQKAASELAEAASITPPGTDLGTVRGRAAAGLLSGLSGGSFNRTSLDSLRAAVRDGAREGVRDALNGRVGNTIVVERGEGSRGESSDETAQRLRSLSELGAI